MYIGYKMVVMHRMVGLYRVVGWGYRKVCGGTGCSWVCRDICECMNGDGWYLSVSY